MNVSRTTGILKNNYVAGTTNILKKFYCHRRFIEKNTRGWSFSGHCIQDTCNMSMKLKLNSKECTDSSLHSIPADIDYDGDANIGKYFNVREARSDEPGEWKSTFRGRLLSGKEIEIPAGYQGVVVHEKDGKFTDQQDRTLQGGKSFKKFMYWNVELPPSSDDVMMKSFDWLQVANIVHSPLNVDEEEDKMKSSPN